MKRLLALVAVAVVAALPITYLLNPTAIQTVTGLHAAPPPPDLPGMQAARLQQAENGDRNVQFSLALDFEKGRMGRARDMEQARLWYERAGNQGHPGAQNNLGNIYFEGNGVPKDLDKAKYWYERSAEQNDINGTYSLGRYYQETKQFTEALTWYEKSAALGSTDALVNMGRIYNNGWGVPADPAKAMEFYQKAVALGSGMAANNVGAMYHNGEGVKRNYATAAEWYQKSAAMNVALAQRNLGKLYYHGNGVPRDFVKARELFARSAAQGDSEAVQWMAYLNFAGIAGEQDMAEAIRQYENAANAGNVDAMQALGWFYEEGKGTRRDMDKAEEWRKKAFDAAKKRFDDGDRDDAILDVLASSYYFGLATDKNEREGMKYYEMNASKSGQAEYMIGRAYFDGDAGYDQNYDKAFEWMNKAAEDGNYSAYRHLAYAYCAGKGVKRDRAKSRYYIEEAAKRGDPVARGMLRENDDALLGVLVHVVRNMSPLSMLRPRYEF